MGIGESRRASYCRIVIFATAIILDQLCTTVVLQVPGFSPQGAHPDWLPLAWRVPCNRPAIKQRGLCKGLQLSTRQQDEPCGQVRGLVESIHVRRFKIDNFYQIIYLSTMHILNISVENIKRFITINIYLWRWILFCLHEILSHLVQAVNLCLGGKCCERFAVFNAPSNKLVNETVASTFWDVLDFPFHQPTQG